MKHLYLLPLCWLVATLALAQRPGGVTTNAAPGGGGPPLVLEPEPPFTHLVDSLLQPISKTPVPGGILYDRVLPLAMLHVFNSARVDTSSFQHFQQAYRELYRAAYNRTAFAYLPDNLPRLAAPAAPGAPVRLGVLDYQFGYLDTLAVQDNLLQFQNGLYYDVAGRPRSPFRTRQLVLAGTLADSAQQSATFTLSPTFCLGNRGRAISSLLVDFGNGQGAVSCPANQSVVVSWPTTGIKHLRYTVSFSDGSTAQAASTLLVTAAVASRPPDTDYLVTAGIPFGHLKPVKQ